MGKRSLWAAATGSPSSPWRKRRGVSASPDPEPEALSDVLAVDDEESPRPRSAPDCLGLPRWRCIVLQFQNAIASSLVGRLTRGKGVIIAKFKDKNDAANINSKNGVEWYHFEKMSLMTLMTSFLQMAKMAVNG